MNKCDFMSKQMSRSHIYVIGLIELQNFLLSNFIEERTGITCSCQQRYMPFKAMDCPSLILWEYSMSDFKSLSSWIFANNITSYKKYYFALFNVSPEEKRLEALIQEGIRGVFYKIDSPATIAKGVMAILSGELWLSRRLLSKTITSRMKKFNNTKTVSPPLTSREIEILSKLSEGYTNAEIADELCISIHTVKTHLYNIYEKLHVSNRLQATLWAAKNQWNMPVKYIDDTSKYG